MGLWPKSLIGHPVNVIFRSDPTVAVESVEVIQAWDGQIVISNVK